MNTRKAQFSTYLKPIIVVIFVILLITVVQQVLTFQVSSEQQEQEVTFAQNVPKTFQQIANCLQSDRNSGNRYLLSSDNLEQYDNDYDGREPPCAEDFRYGYNVTVTPEPILLKSNEIDNEPAEFPVSPGSVSGDIALVIDRSAGMSGHKLTTAKEAVNTFLASNINTNRMALVSFSDEATQDQDFTTDGFLLYPEITGLESGGRTDIAAGLGEALDLSWDDSSESHMLVLTDGGDTSQDVQQIAEEARDDGIFVHGIMYGNDADTETVEQIAGANDCEQDNSENLDGDRCWWWEIEPVNRSRSEVLDGLRDYYSDSLVSTISNAEYTFGEQNSSTGQSLRESLTLNYPVSIRYRPDLVLPATLNIEYRDGDLEFLVGFLNKVIKQGEQADNFFSARFEYINSQEICSIGNKICLTGTDNACVELRSDDIEPFHLQPGQYALTANYSNPANTLYVNGGQDGGCNR